MASHETLGNPAILDQKPVTAVLAKVLKAAFLGLLLGYLAALWLSQWVWLEMRVNVGAVIPGMILASVALSRWIRISLPGAFMLVLETILAVSFVTIYGWSWDALRFIPACLFREGFQTRWLGIDLINMLLIMLWLGANGGWLVAEFRGRRCSSPCSQTAP